MKAKKTTKESLPKVTKKPMTVSAAEAAKVKGGRAAVDDGGTMSGGTTTTGDNTIQM